MKASWSTFSCRWKRKCRPFSVYERRSPLEVWTYSSTTSTALQPVKFLSGLKLLSDLPFADQGQHQRLVLQRHSTQGQPALRTQQGLGYLKGRSVQVRCSPVEISQTECSPERTAALTAPCSSMSGGAWTPAKASDPSTWVSSAAQPNSLQPRDAERHFQPVDGAAAAEACNSSAHGHLTIPHSCFLPFSSSLPESSPNRTTGAELSPLGALVDGPSLGLLDPSSICTDGGLDGLFSEVIGEGSPAISVAMSASQIDEQTPLQVNASGRTHCSCLWFSSPDQLSPTRTATMTHITCSCAE